MALITVVLRAALLVAAVVGVAFLLARPSAAEANHLCGATGSPLGAFDMETYEAEDYGYVYAQAIELAGYNALFPDLEAFAVPSLGSGDREAGLDFPVDGYIPPVLLKAIATIESGWAQADWSVPYGAVGDVLASHDCGYGIMQITSGMQNATGVPNLEQAMIGGHFAFNIARGANILADKWNLAPVLRPIVGERDPTVIEDWYFALWGYNGFAFQNHPLNPAFSAGRVPFSCGPQDDGFSHDRTRYPYQELVLGCVQHPAVVAGEQLWEPQEVLMPDLTAPAFADPLNVANWNGCSLSAECAAMDMPTPVLPSSLTDTASATADPEESGTSSPAASSLEIALSLLRDEIIGAPAIFASPSNVEIVAVPGVSTGEATITILNSGSGVLAYRVVATAPWIEVSRHQGLALGTDVGLRLSSIKVTADVTGLPPGEYSGEVIIDSLHAEGAPWRISVVISSFPTGTLIRGSGPGVYVMRDGLKRGIPNVATFEANGFDWDDVSGIPNSNIDGVPTGKMLPNVIATGNLIRGTVSGLHVMDGGLKRPIDSDVLDACGYDSNAAYTLSELTLGRIETGPQINGSSCPRVSPPDGHLVRNSAGTVFVMSKGLRRGIPNIPTFEARGFAWANVDQYHDSIASAVASGHNVPSVLTTGSVIAGSSGKLYVMEAGLARAAANDVVTQACGYDSIVDTISNASLGKIEKGPELSELPCVKWVPSDGSLIRNSIGAVYLIEGGLKRAVPNLETFESTPFHWGNVDQTPDSRVAAVPTGKSLTSVLSDGHLLTDSRPGIYIMEGGARRPIGSATLFELCGYDWGNVRGISDGRFARIPVGPPVTGPPCPAQSFD
ncbi:MAG: hypothetical protein IH957_03840 [Chloroflexi bacterium]|nr:hypothetical protein [Chloroflexota bacterium]